MTLTAEATDLCPVCGTMMPAKRPAGQIYCSQPCYWVARREGKYNGPTRDHVQDDEPETEPQPAPEKIATDERPEGLVHPAFSKVLALAKARKNIYLPGPAGCGKSHLGKQIAEALGLPFGAISCSAGMSEAQLLGRMIPTGDAGQFEFQTTLFLECYENGGVFLFDEIDAADSNVLLVINSALANGYLSVPSRTDQPIANKHPDFVCIAAANTFGSGADRMYVGRNQLDEATLDRFRIGMVPMDYSEGLEKRLCPDAALRIRLQAYRKRCMEHKLHRIVSTRFMKDAYDMLQFAGWTLADIDEQLFQGWREDEIRRVKGGA